jgi:SPP1 gp7 family putative phage head morphogenesis protein
MSKSRAILIARDQTTKLHAALDKARQTAARVKSYCRSTSQDERVRPSHAELDGKTLSWDDPPVVDDEVANPGEPIQCRLHRDSGHQGPGRGAGLRRRGGVTYGSNAHR